MTVNRQIILNLPVAFAAVLCCFRVSAAPPPETSLTRGRAALADGLYEAASGYFGSVLTNRQAAADRRFDALEGMARVMLLREDFEGLEALVEAHRGMAADLEEAWRLDLWSAQAALRRDQPGYAEEILAAIAPRGHTDAEVIAARTRALLALGRGERALEVVQAGLSALERGTESWRGLKLDEAAVFKHIGRSGRALEELRGITAEWPLTPEDFAARLWAGRILVEEDEPEKALKIFGELVDEAEAPTGLRCEGAYAAATALKRIGDYSAALEFAERGKELADNAELYDHGVFLRGRLLLSLDRPEEGAGLIRSWVAAHPADPRAPRWQLTLADTLLDHGYFEQAQAEYRHYLEAFGDDPGSGRALLGKGWSLLERGVYDEAAVRFDNAYQRSDGHDWAADALLKHADALFLAGRYATASDAYAKFKRVFETEPRRPQAAFQHAESVARDGRTEQARELFGWIGENYPESRLAREGGLRAAVLLEEAGLWEDAERQYEELLDLYPGETIAARAMQGRGLVRYRRGNFKQALEDFEEVVKRFPEHESARQAFYMRGWSLYLMGEDERALEICRSFIELYPDSPWAPEVLFWLSEYHYNSGDYELAEEGFVELAERWPDESIAADARYWAGRAAAARKDFNRAVEHFNRLVRESEGGPIVAEARFAQGDALSELGRFDEAIVVFDDIVRHHPDSYLLVPALGRRGDCQFTLGADDPSRYLEALDSYRRALEVRPEKPELSWQLEYKLGRCYEKLEQLERAFEHYLNVVYAYLQDGARAPGSDSVWFSRAAFGAADLKKQQGLWREAVDIYQRVVQAGVPAAEEADKRIRRLRLENLFRFN